MTEERPFCKAEGHFQNTETAREISESPEQKKSTTRSKQFLLASFDIWESKNRRQFMQLERKSIATGSSKSVRKLAAESKPEYSSRVQLKKEQTLTVGDLSLENTINP